MDGSKPSDDKRRDDAAHGKTGEGSTSALKEMVKRAALQPDTTSDTRPDVPQPERPEAARLQAQPRGDAA
jgi:hypothetical protein